MLGSMAFELEVTEGTDECCSFVLQGQCQPRQRLPVDCDGVGHFNDAARAFEPYTIQ